MTQRTRKPTIIPLLSLGILATNDGFADMRINATPMVPNDVHAMGVFFVVLVIGVIGATYWLCRGLDKTARPTGSTSDERDSVDWLMRRFDEIYPVLVALKRLTADGGSATSPYADLTRDVGLMRQTLIIRLKTLRGTEPGAMAPDHTARPRRLTETHE